MHLRNSPVDVLCGSVPKHTPALHAKHYFIHLSFGRSVEIIEVINERYFIILPGLFNRHRLRVGRKVGRWWCLLVSLFRVLIFVTLESSIPITFTRGPGFWV